MRSIKELKNLKGKRVLVRVDFNVPMQGDKVEDDFRIKKALPTIEYLKKKGAKIMLITHLGKGGDTLAPIAKALNKYIKADFVEDIIGEKAHEAVAKMANGDVVLLENLRNDIGEKECSKIFAISLAKLADMYVNEAFPVSHRADASLVLLPKILPSYAGLQLVREVNNLSRAFDKPQHPFLFILGGAKFSTKMPLIKKYLRLADYVFIGGALADDFLKAKGYEVGHSLVDDADYDLAKVLKSKKLILPTDVVVENGNKVEHKNIDEVVKGDTIVDIGDGTVADLEVLIKKAKLVLWNGPLGKYEDKEGAVATREILKTVAGAKALSIIGGGDTVELISEMKMEDKFTFVSTGGGATLDFLADGTLPGIKVLK